MRSMGMWKLMGYAFAATFTLFAFAWMKWAPSERIQRHERTAVTQLPLSFEVNRGQAAGDTEFVARSAGYTMLLTDRGEPVLALDSQSHKAARPDAKRQLLASSESGLRKPTGRDVLRLRFPSGNPAPQMEGEQLLPGRSNYLLGNDPQKWLIGIPHYARVRYHGVFPGVDVLYYVNERQLEYDFIIQPGNSPDSIRMAANGAQRIEQSDSGGLILNTASGSVELHRPTAYQQGADGRREVSCNYVLDKDEIRFAIGDYDRSQVLRIDPVLSYSKPLDSFVRAIAVDASGNSYLAGSTVSANFPTTANAFQHLNGGNADAVIAKLDPTGSTLLFATYLGGNGYDSANSIAIDSSGDVVVAGTTRSTNLPINHAFQSTLLGTEDSFLSKLNTDGTQLLYSTYLGGSGSEWALGVALDSSGRAAMTGVTSSSNFPTSLGALQTIFGGGDWDAFIAQIDTTKSGVASLLFSTYLGGSNRDAGGAVAVDVTGSVFVTGLTISSNFPTANPMQASCASCPTGSDTNLVPAGVADAFVSKLNATGTALVYSTFLGGNSGDAGNAIAVDSAGNAYVSGTTFSWRGFPTTAGAFQTTLGDDGGYGDGFVFKLDSSGSVPVYSTLVGGDGDDRFVGIALDRSDNAYLTGFTNSTDFPSVDALQGPGGGVCDFVLFPDYCSDVVVAELNASGSALLYSTYLGHANINESGTAIAVDSAGNTYVAGATNIIGDTDLLSLIRLGPPSSASNDIEPTGFVAKIGRASIGTGPTSVSLTSSPNPSSIGQSVTFTATVTPPGASGVVNFRVDNASIGSVTLNAGEAKLSHAPLSGGNHSFRAEYLGDARYAASTSASLTQIVNSISLTAAQSSATTAKGGTATFPLTVGQTGSLASAITFSCSGLPGGWSCGFNPAIVSAGSGPTQVALTVQAGSATAQNLPRALMGSFRSPGITWPGFLALLTLAIVLRGRVRKVICLRPAVALACAALLLLASGCGSDSSQQPQSSKVNFTVNAESDTTTTSMPLTIVVR